MALYEAGALMGLPKARLHVLIVDGGSSGAGLYDVFEVQAREVARQFFSSFSQGTCSGNNSDVVKRDVDGAAVLHLSKRVFAAVARGVLGGSSSSSSSNDSTSSSSSGGVGRYTGIQLWRKAARGEATADTTGKGWVPAYDHCGSPGRTECLAAELGAAFAAGLPEPVVAAVCVAATGGAEGGLAVAVVRPLLQSVTVYELRCAAAAAPTATANNSTPTRKQQQALAATALAADLEGLASQLGVQELLLVSRSHAAVPTAAAAVERALARVAFSQRLPPASALGLAEAVAAFCVPDSTIAVGVASSPAAVLQAAHAALSYSGAAPAAYQYQLQRDALERCLRYDASVSAALALVPPRRAGAGGKLLLQGAGGDDEGGSDGEQQQQELEQEQGRGEDGPNSVLSLLSTAARSSGGRRLLKSWLLVPLAGAQGLHTIRARQQVVKSLVASTSSRSQLRDSATEGLLRCPDVEAAAARFVRLRTPASTAGGDSSSPQEQYKAGLADMVQVYRAVLRLRGVEAALASASAAAAAGGDGYNNSGNSSSSSSSSCSSTSPHPLLQSAADALGKIGRFQALVEEVVCPQCLCSARGGVPHSGSSPLHEKHSRFLGWLRRANGSSKRVSVRRTFTAQLESMHQRADAALVAVLAEAEAVAAACAAAADSAKPASKAAGGGRFRSSSSKGNCNAPETHDRVFLEYSSTHGVHLRVTKREQAAVTAALQQLHVQRRDGTAASHTVLSTQKAGVLFRTPRLDTAVAHYGTCLESVKLMETNIAQQATAAAATYRPVMRLVASVLAEADAFAALAHVAALNNWCCPSVGAAQTRVTGLRHPLVEARVGAASYVPSDFAQGAGGGVTVVTGPNCGGKSTYIRALATAVVLAQMGSHVPAASCALPLFSRVLCRVGAADSLGRGVSTFQAEMLGLHNIVCKADCSSLVIIDELGRGTSTQDGFGIAAAAVQRLAAVGAVTVFATHFHELTLLAGTSGGGVHESAGTDSGGVFKIDAQLAKRISNKHVAAHVGDGQVTMLFSVRDGPCQQSYGIRVAAVAGFPRVVVAEAEAIRAGLEQCRI